MRASGAAEFRNPRGQGPDDSAELLSYLTTPGISSHQGPSQSGVHCSDSSPSLVPHTPSLLLHCGSPALSWLAYQDLPCPPEHCLHPARGSCGHQRASRFRGSELLLLWFRTQCFYFYIVYLCVFASTVSCDAHLQGGKLRLREVHSGAGVQAHYEKAQLLLASVTMPTLREVWKRSGRRSVH